MRNIKLLCCMKIVAGLESCTDLGPEIKNNTLDMSFLPKQLNCFDASFAELALRLKHQKPEDIELGILSVSGGGEERFFTPLLALGADSCTIIKDEAELMFSPAEVAFQIAEFVRREPQDWLLFGCYQSLGQNGMTGIHTAKLLNLPCYTGVTDMSLDNGKLIITRRADEAFISHSVSGPGVLILDESVTCLLHTPSLMQVLAARRLGMGAAEAKENKIKLKDPELISLREEHAESHCRMLKPRELAQLVEELIREDRGKC